MDCGFYDRLYLPSSWPQNHRPTAPGASANFVHSNFDKHERCRKRHDRRCPLAVLSGFETLSVGEVDVRLSSIPHATCSTTTASCILHPRRIYWHLPKTFPFDQYNQTRNTYFCGLTSEGRRGRGGSRSHLHARIV